jgi:hypothetical protein
MARRWGFDTLTALLGDNSMYSVKAVPSECIPYAR